MLIRSFWIIILLLGWNALLSSEELSVQQEQLAGRFVQLERLLLRLNEVFASTNPQRAQLLKKGILTSKEKLLVVRLDNLVRQIERGQLTDAILSQESVEKDFFELLLLLEQADREERRTAEKESIKEFLRNLDEILHRERSLKNRVVQSDEKMLQSLQEEQESVRQKTHSLENQIAEQGNSEKPITEQSVSSPVSDSKSDSKSESKSEKNLDSNAQKKGESADNTTDSASQSAQNQSESPANPKQESTSPTERALNRAAKRMSEAEKRLRAAEKDAAMQEQEEAIAELQKAKAELEKILRQLRDEEILQTLEKLETRLKRMCKLEESIRTQTTQLRQERETATESQMRQIGVRAGQISFDQQSVIDDSDAALILLREDGTARAILESLLLARFDMTESKRRL
ncbi:MAG: hypothetical protein ACRCUY_13205, partial [Thermoguttaceae bacterium]